MTYRGSKGGGGEKKKDKNSNIQPYKTIRRTSVHLSAIHAVREEALRVQIEKIFYSPLLFINFLVFFLFFFLES